MKRNTVLAAVAFMVTFMVTTSAVAGEVVVSGGVTTAMNTAQAGREGTALSLSYRGPMPAAAAKWSVGWVHEDFPHDFLQRDGVTTEVLLALRPQGDRFNISLVLGPCVYRASGRYNEGSGYGLALRAGFDAEYRFTRHLALHAGFRSMTTSSAPNTSSILVGLDYYK